MSKQIGDRLLDSIRRAAFEDIEWHIDRGVAPTVNMVWESIWPSKTLGGLVEEEIGHRGLDGRFYVQYYRQSLDVAFMQTDAESLEDLYSTAMTTGLHITGMETRITLVGGQQLVLTMHYTRRLNAAGHGTTLVVELRGESVSTTPVLQ